MIEERAFDRRVHIRSLFDCGVPALNEYLQRNADAHRLAGVGATYVLVDSAAPRIVLGYYALGAVELDTEQLADNRRRKLARYPIAAFRLTRLASHIERRGEGIGRMLIGAAVARCLRVRGEVGVDALMADAMDGKGKRFYQHFGFEPMRDRAMTLHLPLGL